VNSSVVYWDACTYLDYLTGAHELKDAMELLIEDWHKGLVTIVTSTLTIAEVLFVRIQGKVDRTRERDIDALFDPPSPRKLLLVELNRLTALNARDIARIGVQPRDAIHIASAIEAHCPLMHTTDQPLWARSGLVGGSPALRIEPPSWVKQTEVQADIDPGKFTSLVGPTEPPRLPGRSGDAPPA
jgi:predicted nucleic acid-binding protein